MATSMIKIGGVYRQVQIEDLSVGCTEHSALFCLRLRLTDTGQLLHFPGHGDIRPPRPQWPPATIAAWVGNHYVDNSNLVKELREWLDYFDKQ